MKKISGKRRAKIICHNARRERARLRRLLVRRRAPRRTRKKAPIAPRTALRKRIAIIPQTRAFVRLPAVLSLKDNFEETAAVLLNMRNLVLHNRRPIVLDFSNVTEIEAAATLLITAEIYRCNKVARYKRGLAVSGTYPHDHGVHLQLREMGFFKLIDVPDRDEIVDDRKEVDRPRFLRFFTFDAVMSVMAAALSDIVAVGAFEMSTVVKGRMTGALKEAMGNAVEHAYKQEGIHPSMKGRWFCAASVNPVQGEMMIALFDQGVGIPVTLDATAFERIMAILERGSISPSDGNMIAAATELYRTSTGQRGRGRGFRDMKKFVDSCDDGELRVLSNRGSYRYMKGDEKIIDHRLSIEGTLVEWRVRHGQAVEFEDA